MIQQIPATQSIKEENFSKEKQPIKTEPRMEETHSIKTELPNEEQQHHATKQISRPKRTPKVRLVDESLLTTKYAPRALEDIVGNQNAIRNLYNWLLHWDSIHASSILLSFFA